MAGRRVIFLGPGHLQVDPPNGKFYEPGEPVTLPDIQRANLTANGLRFGAVPDEPEPEPAVDPPPALESVDVSKAAMDSQPPPVAPPTPDDAASSETKATAGKGTK